MAIKKILIILLLLSAFPSYGQDIPSNYIENLPLKDVTPGDTLTSDKSVVCSHNYSINVRYVTWGMKQHVYESYGLSNRDRSLWVIDHLIPLCAGGSNSVYNLWPQQKYIEWSDTKKDELEVVGCKAICTGKIDIKEFQHDIAEDWVKSYRKYVR